MTVPRELCSEIVWIHAILLMKTPPLVKTITSNGKIPSTLMTGLGHRLPFNFPTLKFPTLLDQGKEFLKPRGLLQPCHSPVHNKAVYLITPIVATTTSLLSNNNPNVLLLPLLNAFVILLCLIVLLNKSNPKVELCRIFLTSSTIKSNAASRLPFLANQLPFRFVSPLLLLP